METRARSSPWRKFWWCAVLAAVALAVGVATPIYLEAVETGVIEQAGRHTPSAVEHGLELVRLGRLGVADLVQEAARKDHLAGWEGLQTAWAAAVKQHPDWLAWGGDSRLGLVFGAQPGATNVASEPLTDFLIRRGNRAKAIEYLQAKPGPAVQEFLRCRSLTNTQLIPAATSASGQAFDAALSVCGLLVADGRLSPGLTGELHAMASRAAAVGDSRRFEQALLDFMSLGRQLNLDQLAGLLGRVDDAATLGRLAESARGWNDSFPQLFAAVEISGDPGAAGRYLATFGETGMKDLRTSLASGAGGVKELLARRQRLFRAWDHPTPEAPPAAWAAFRFGAFVCQRAPSAALGLKWFSYLAGGLLLAGAVHQVKLAAGGREGAADGMSFRPLREGLLAPVVLVLALLLGEPFLAPETPKTDFHLRLAPPTVEAAQAGLAGAKSSLMNQNNNLLTLLLFFSLQGLLYLACVMKLGEIRRQPTAARIRLKLLENEEHLFDGGLYLGFLGTIVSFILVSLGLTKFSLMAAYSSTAFGISFVSIFKIFLLRPARRRLLVEAEEAAEGSASRVGGSKFAAAP